MRRWMLVKLLLLVVNLVTILPTLGESSTLYQRLRRHQQHRHRHRHRQQEQQADYWKYAQRDCRMQVRVSSRHADPTTIACNVVPWTTGGHSVDEIGSVRTSRSLYTPSLKLRPAVIVNFDKVQHNCINVVKAGIFTIDDCIIPARCGTMSSQSTRSAAFHYHDNVVCYGDGTVRPDPTSTYYGQMGEMMFDTSAVFNLGNLLTKCLKGWVYAHGADGYWAVPRVYTRNMHQTDFNGTKYYHPRISIEHGCINMPTKRTAVYKSLDDLLHRLIMGSRCEYFSETTILTTVEHNAEHNITVDVLSCDRKLDTVHVHESHIWYENILERIENWVASLIDKAASFLVSIVTKLLGYLTTKFYLAEYLGLYAILIIYGFETPRALAIVMLTASFIGIVRPGGTDTTNNVI